MSEIYSNNYLKISKDTSKSIFTIELSVSNQILINSLIKTRIIQGGTVTDDYKSIKFKAQSVKSLLQFKEEHNKILGSYSLPINIVAKMLNNLGNQLNYLERIYSCTILGYTPENVIVINDQKFAFVGSEYITEIDNNMILISSPFTSKDFYLSPELLNINELPSFVNYKTSYFSLACLLINALLSNEDFYEDYLKHQQTDIIIKHLNTHLIKETRLYWLLSRCLVEDPKNRCIQLI